MERTTVDSKVVGGKVYVFFKRGLHGSVVIEDVCLPGDMTPIYNKLSPDERRHLERLVELQLERRRRRA